MIPDVTPTNPAALCERFGPYLTNSAGKKVSTRKLAEQHVVEDLGFIPSLDQSLKHTPITRLVAPRLRKVIVLTDKEK